MILLVHAALLGYSAVIHSPVPDEPAHLAAGLSHWKFGQFALYRVNPPLVRMIATAPLLLTDIRTDWGRYYEDSTGRGEYAVGDDLVAANGSAIFRYVAIARLACVPFSLLGCLVCYWWAKLLFGRLPGLVAAALWSSSPMILGHGSLMTPDVAATALGLAACFLFSRWLVAPRWGQVLLIGAVLGLAETVKSTWIILFPAFVAIWIMFRLISTPPLRKPSAVQLTAILCIGWLFLVAIYGAQGVGSRLGAVPFQSNLFRTLFCLRDQNGNFAVRPALAAVPIPVARNYLMGIDQQYRDLEGPDRSYLRGVWSSEGWWYYYAYGLGVKEPLGGLTLAALSMLYWCGLLSRSVSRRRLSPTRIREFGAAGMMLLCPVTVFVVASINTGMNHHVRYVMPVLPYLFILASGLVANVGPGRTIRALMTAVALGYAIISSLLVFPHSLSYFNELAGGPKGGVFHLSSSNLDWGQDLLLLAEWKRKHAPNETIYLAYFGRVNPVYAGIDHQPPPPVTAARDAVPGWTGPLKPGWYAVGAMPLQGRAYHVQLSDGQWVATPENAFVYFQELTPVTRVGYSIYIYRVEGKTAR